jgi:hypothetical protein
MRIAFAVSAALILTACSPGADSGPVAQLDGLTVPDLGGLSAKIQDAFKAVKLTGYPRVSAARPAPVSALGDWIVCLRSDAEADPRTYALMIANNDIVDYRLALIVDGCEHERFAPLPTARMAR